MLVAVRAQKTKLQEALARAVQKLWTQQDELHQLRMQASHAKQMERPARMHVSGLHTEAFAAAFEFGSILMVKLAWWLQASQKLNSMWLPASKFFDCRCASLMAGQGLNDGCPSWLADCMAHWLGVPRGQVWAASAIISPLISLHGQS